METLYKRDTTGNIRSWRIEVEDGRYRTIAGVLDGSMVTSAWTQAEVKNVGRSNETAPGEQARLEAEALHLKKTERGYTSDLTAIDKQKFRSPMLAKKYEDVKFTFPAYSQPKLDGIRCVTNSEGMWSRAGKPILGAMHIFNALQPFFEKHPTAELDGELYNHEFHDDFNAIISMVRKNETTPESVRFVQYHVYDLISAAEAPFADRYGLLYHLIHDHFTPVIQLVETDRVDNQVQLDGLYESYMNAKYEGQMVRDNQPYEFKRSKTLLKRKEFQDSEFPIAYIEEGKGNWAGCARKVGCLLPDGRDFKADFCGTMAQARAILVQADEFTGKETTVNHFGFTPAGIPRFGKVKALHKEARL